MPQSQKVPINQVLVASRRPRISSGANRQLPERAAYDYTDIVRNRWAGAGGSHSITEWLS